MLFYHGALEGNKYLIVCIILSANMLVFLNRVASDINRFKKIVILKDFFLKTII